MRMAQEKGYLDFTAHDLRDWTHDKHRTTDDEPYGGGQGLVMKCEPIFEACDDLFAQSEKKPYVIFLSPTGEVFNDALTLELARKPHLFFICGHYEGIDERVIEELDPEEISVGDYVLTGGELPALILADSVSRMLPGVLSDDECFEEESHFNSLLEYPQYTHPSSWNGRDVPEILLSGHHAKVDEWRRQKSLERTYRRRPDMLERAKLDKKDEAFLSKLEKE